MTVCTLLGQAVLVLHRHLGLAIGTQVRKITLFPGLGHAAAYAVGQGNGQRHQLGRLVARETDHHTLVACTQRFHLMAIVTVLVPDLQRR